jgi:hypothetical protein
MRTVLVLHGPNLNRPLSWAAVPIQRGTLAATWGQVTTSPLPAA